MDGILQRLRRRRDGRQRELVERLLHEAWPDLARAHAVLEAARTLGRDDLVVRHYTFDEPEVGADAATLQVTFQFGGPAGADGIIDEVRGAAVVTIDDHGRVRFLDVEADPFRLLDDVAGDAVPD